MKTTKSIKTVNVVEIIDADSPSIVSFPATKAGRKAAENAFKAIALQQETTNDKEEIICRFDTEEIKEALKNGYGLSDEDGTWSVQIIESIARL